ncbi:MAG TPA: ANTAR domain-containing protein [Acidimicrobiales bacterium]|nr:ANTAR domain-containing protein [Acidimicrobiales bacterium]
MESQSLIGQATGPLMATEQRTSEEALGRLRELALASGEPMRTVAEWVITERPTGASPSTPERDPATESEDG